MKYIILIAQFLFLTACAAAEPKIPAKLVGVWASENAVLKDDKWLVSGQALYLAADGNGAWVGGPPPIGINISANFDNSKNILSLDLLENNKVVKSSSILYDADAKTLNVGSTSPLLLKRRSEVMDSSIKSGLGL